MIGRYAKFLSAAVGAVLGIGVSALLPGLAPVWATVLTGGLSALSALLGPANTPPSVHED